MDGLTNERRKTCHGCERLHGTPIPHSGFLWTCGSGPTAAIVPQTTEGSHRNGYSTEFTRVPLECPLPDSDVVKSEKPCHPKDRAAIKFSAEEYQ